LGEEDVKIGNFSAEFSRHSGAEVRGSAAWAWGTPGELRKAESSRASALKWNSVHNCDSSEMFWFVIVTEASLIASTKSRKTSRRTRDFTGYGESRRLGSVVNRAQFLVRSEFGSEKEIGRASCRERVFLSV
jgi:hypothetical protein